MDEGRDRGDDCISEGAEPPSAAGTSGAAVANLVIAQVGRLD
jgi:hypothetical protein